MTFAIPPCLHFLSKCEWSSLWILPKFSVPPLLGSQLRLIPPLVLLKIKWFTLKSSAPPPSAINNDQSLSFSSLIAHETSRTHTYCHVSFKKGIPNRVLQSINPEPKFRAIPYSWWFYSASPPSTPTQSLNPGSRPEFAWKSRIPSFKWGKSRIPKIVWGHSYWLSVRAHEKQQPLVWFILN